MPVSQKKNCDRGVDITVTVVLIILGFFLHEHNTLILGQFNPCIVKPCKLT